MPPRLRPRRRLPDLCLIALFKQLEPKDQVKASRMNSRCAILVRAANRRVRTLVITDSNNYEDIKRHINFYSLASVPSMQQLANVSEPLVNDYPMTKRISKWNCLHVCHLPTTEELVTIFSAVTDFKFILWKEKYFEYLVNLLCHPGWAVQLTSFMFDVHVRRVSKDVFIRLCDAINGLFALKNLAINFGWKVPMPEFSILAQLKVIAMIAWNDQLPLFLRTLERHAAANDALRVHLLSNCDKNDLLSLSEPLCSRIFYIGGLNYSDSFVTFLSRHFTSLTSLTVWGLKTLDVGPLFTGLSQLPQLVHLKLEISFCKLPSSELPWSSRPQAQLKSVRALDLWLTITSHSQVSWLNLQQTLPHLQVIHLRDFQCASCIVRLQNSHERLNSLTSSAVCKCLRESLLPHLHLGVHPGRIIFQLGFYLYNFQFFSFEQL